MRKILCLLFVLLALIPAAYAEESEAIDIPSGWYIIEIPGSAPIAIFLQNGMMITRYDPVDADEAPAQIAADAKSGKSFTLSPGKYIAGIDFPAGSYSAEFAGSTHYTTAHLSIYVGQGALEKKVFSENVGVAETKIGKVEMLEGYTIVIDYGAIHFDDPVGAVFD